MIVQPVVRRSNPLSRPLSAATGRGTPAQDVEGITALELGKRIERALEPDEKQSYRLSLADDLERTRGVPRPKHAAGGMLVPAVDVDVKRRLQECVAATLQEPASPANQGLRQRAARSQFAARAPR